VLKAFNVVGTMLTCLLLASCGDSTGPEEGVFSVTIGGDTTLTVEGEAIFGLSTTQGVEHWVIFLSRGTFGGLDFDAVAIGRHGSATPIGVGTHPIADADSDATQSEDIDAVYALQRSADGSIGYYGSESGTLTISNADDDRIRGEFNFTAEFEFAVGAFGEIRNLTLEGSFTAVRGDVPSIGS